MFVKCCGKQESPPTFLLSNKGKGEKNRKRPFEIISKEGRLWKGKVLALFPSVVIYGLLDAISFENTLCFVCLKKYIEKTP